MSLTRAMQRKWKQTCPDPDNKLMQEESYVITGFLFTFQKIRIPYNAGLYSKEMRYHRITC